MQLSATVSALVVGLRHWQGIAFIQGEEGTAVMKIEGGCHCGHITYEAEADPNRVFLCHCEDCQIISGGAYRTVVRVDEEDFRLLSGTLKTYVKIAQSGNERAQCFCPECGTHIYATTVDDDPSKVYRIRVATARQRDELPPKAQIWFRSAQPWTTELGSIRSIEKQQ